MITIKKIKQERNSFLYFFKYIKEFERNKKREREKEILHWILFIVYFKCSEIYLILNLDMRISRIFQSFFNINSTFEISRYNARLFCQRNLIISESFSVGWLNLSEYLYYIYVHWSSFRNFILPFSPFASMKLFLDDISRFVVSYNNL